jgi:hypothetical protein
VILMAANAIHVQYLLKLIFSAAIACAKSNLFIRLKTASAKLTVCVKHTLKSWVVLTIKVIPVPIFYS